VTPGDANPDTVQYVVQRSAMRTPGTDRLSQQSRYQGQYRAQRRQVPPPPAPRTAPQPSTGKVPATVSAATAPVPMPRPQPQPVPAPQVQPAPAPARTTTPATPTALQTADIQAQLTRQDYRDRYQARQRQQQQAQAAREAAARIMPGQQPATTSPPPAPTSVASLADRPATPPSTGLNPQAMPSPTHPQPTGSGIVQAAEAASTTPQARQEPQTRPPRESTAARTTPAPRSSTAGTAPAAPSVRRPDISGNTNACGELASNPLSQSSADKVAAQYAAAVKIPEPQAIRGDLVFFRTDGNSIDHVGIYLGNNKFVHAPGAGKSITTDSLTDSWKEQFAGFGRLPPSCRASGSPL